MSTEDLPLDWQPDEFDFLAQGIYDAAHRWVWEEFKAGRLWVRSGDEVKRVLGQPHADRWDEAVARNQRIRKMTPEWEPEHPVYQNGIRCLTTRIWPAHCEIKRRLLALVGPGR